MSSNDSHDFEVIASPEAPKAVTDEHPSHPSADTASNPNSIEKDNSQHALHKLMRVAIIASIPAKQAWSAGVAIAATPYLSTPNKDASPDEKIQTILQRVSEFTERDLDRTKKILAHVDDMSPPDLNKLKEGLPNFSGYIDTAKDTVSKKIMPAAKQVCSDASMFLMIPLGFMCTLFFFRLCNSLPFVLWIGVGYMLRKYRENKTHKLSRSKYRLVQVDID